MPEENVPPPDNGLRPDSPIEPVEPTPLLEPAESERESIGEQFQWEQSETGKARIAFIQAQTELKLAEAKDKAAETALKSAEKSLREVQRAQANDDRWLRYISAGISFLGVVIWTWWMCDFIVMCSTGAPKHHFDASEKVQIALIANTGVAMIGLFAIVLRGLFRVPGSEQAKKEKAE